MKGILTVFCKQCESIADSWAEINYNFWKKAICLGYIKIEENIKL